MNNPTKTQRKWKKQMETLGLETKGDSEAVGVHRNFMKNWDLPRLMKPRA